ncbi:MAG: hypothetical protein ACLQVN_08030 [Bryobacteraceae bacterium]
MTARAHSRIRSALVLLLLCAVTLGQSAALTSTHALHRAQNHDCPVCYLGSLPFLESTAEAPAAPVWLVIRLESPRDFEATHDVRPAARFSRAPPA